MSNNNNDLVTLVPGAILVVHANFNWEELNQINMSIPDRNKYILNNISFSVLVEQDDGSLMSFRINDKHTLSTLTTYKDGEDVIGFLKKLESDKYGKVVNNDDYDALYASTDNWLEIPSNFHDLQIGVLDAEERVLFDADPSFTIANQIQDFRNTYAEILKSNTEWSSPTYRTAWLNNWLRYQDYDLAKMATLNDVNTMNTVYGELGKTASEVAASNFYRMDEGAYKRDFGANLAWINDIETEFTGELDTASKEWVAEKITMGSWSKEFARSQVYKALDSYREGELEPNFAKILEGKDISETTQGQNEVLAMIDKWVPEGYKSIYTDKLNDYAGKYRSDPRWLNTFEEELKNFKYALMPGYDKDTDMSIIDALTKQTIFNKWGMNVDPQGEYKYIYDKVLQLNDVNESNKFLIQEGLNNNIQGVVVPFAKDIMKSFGGSIVRSQDFIEPTTNRRIG